MSGFRFITGLAALSTVAALAGAACGSSSSPSAPTVAADVTITMVGDRGNQSYHTQSEHDARRTDGRVEERRHHRAHATQDASRFDSGTISSGATSAPLTMSTRRHVHISLHDPPGMVGTLIVQ